MKMNTNTQIAILSVIGSTVRRFGVFCIASIVEACLSPAVGFLCNKAKTAA